MKYKLWVFLLLLSCGCRFSPTKEASAVRVSVLRGPSALAFAEWMAAPPTIGGRHVEVKILDSPQLIQAMLVKGETDIAVLPLISATNLYNKGVDYRLAGCPIWGTLYLAGKPDAKTLHLFGAGTTPDILTRHYLERQALSYSLSYAFSTPGEILQGIQAGKVEAAVLSEPFLSMALQKDSSFVILADLNRPKESSPGFPQTAIVYHPELKSFYHQIDSLLAESCGYANRQPEKVIRILEEKKIFPAGALTPKGIERCKIHYVPAAEAEANIFSFLRLVEEYEPKAIGGKLPDRRFIAR